MSVYGAVILSHEQFCVTTTAIKTQNYSFITKMETTKSDSASQCQAALVSALPLNPPPQCDQASSVQSLSCVQLFVTSWTAAPQASQSVTNSWSLLKLMSIVSVIPSNHFILCCLLLLPPSSFPASGPLQMSQFFTSGGQSIGVSASASVLLMNIQD